MPGILTPMCCCLPSPHGHPHLKVRAPGGPLGQVLSLCPPNQILCCPPANFPLSRPPQCQTLPHLPSTVHLATPSLCQTLSLITNDPSQALTVTFWVHAPCTPQFCSCREETPMLDRVQSWVGGCFGSKVTDRSSSFSPGSSAHKQQHRKLHHLKCGPPTSPTRARAWDLHHHSPRLPHLRGTAPCPVPGGTPRCQVLRPLTPELPANFSAWQPLFWWVDA